MKIALLVAVVLLSVIQAAHLKSVQGELEESKPFYVWRADDGFHDEEEHQLNDAYDRDDSSYTKILEIFAQLASNFFSSLFKLGFEKNDYSMENQTSLKNRRVNDFKELRKYWDIEILSDVKSGNKSMKIVFSPRVTFYSNGSMELASKKEHHRQIRSEFEEDDEEYDDLFRFRNIHESEEDDEEKDFDKFMRIRDQFPCIVPGRLENFEIVCTLQENGTQYYCNQTCIQGYTMRHGIQRLYECFDDGEWYPQDPFEKCKRFVVCRIRATGDVDFTCRPPEVLKGTVCDIQCGAKKKRLETLHIHHHRTTPVPDPQLYECDTDGKWHPELPACVEAKGQEYGRETSPPPGPKTVHQITGVNEYMEGE